MVDGEHAPEERPAVLKRAFGRRTVWRLFQGATLLLAVAGFALVVPRLARGPVQLDFDAYYSGARMLNAGRPLYEPPPQALLDATSPAAPHREYVYPPLLAGLLRPLAMLSYRNASMVWLAANVALAAVLVAALAGVARFPRRHRWQVAAGLLLLPALYQTWLEGQVNVIIALLLVAGVGWALDGPPSRSRSDWYAGVALGLACAIKVYPVLLLPVFLWHWRPRILAGAIITGIVATAVGALLSHGLADTIIWFQTVLPGVATRSWPANQSLVAVAGRFAPQAPFMVWDGTQEVLVRLRPLLAGPDQVRWIVRIAEVVLVAASATAILRRPAVRTLAALAPDLALVVTVMSMVSPVVWDHYYLQLAIPIVLALDAAGRDATIRRLLAVSLLLLVLQRFWQQLLRIDQSGWVLMCGLGAVFLLWLAMLRLATRPALLEQVREA